MSFPEQSPQDQARAKRVALSLLAKARSNEISPITFKQALLQPWSPSKLAPHSNGKRGVFLFDDSAEHLYFLTEELLWPEISDMPDRFHQEYRALNVSSEALILLTEPGLFESESYMGMRQWVYL